MEEFNDTTHLKDSKQQTEALRYYGKSTEGTAEGKVQHPQYAHSGTPVSKQPFLNWTDVTTSRYETLVENLFGESIQVAPEVHVM